MPRMNRLDLPGSLVHIMAHGIDGRKLFLDDEDRTEFVKRLASGLKKTRFDCLAWSLMDNHYHLLVRTTELPMSKLMRALNSSYARYYNKRYERSGYLFQNRFKSVVCQDMHYAANLIVYIHLNPLRGGIVKTIEQLESYTWCGHREMIACGGYSGSFMNVKESLRRFGEKDLEAVINYKRMVSSTCNPESDNSKAGSLDKDSEQEIRGAFKGWPAVIGNPEFVKRVMEQHKISMHRMHRKADYYYVLEKIANEVCLKFNISRKELFKRGRRNSRSQARADFCYRTHIEELLPVSVVAEYLQITISPVTVLVERGEACLEKRMITEGSIL